MIMAAVMEAAAVIMAAAMMEIKAAEASLRKALNLKYLLKRKFMIMLETLQEKDNTLEATLNIKY